MISKLLGIDLSNSFENNNLIGYSIEIGNEK